MSLARLPIANLTLRLTLCLISLGICLHFAAEIFQFLPLLSYKPVTGRHCSMPQQIDLPAQPGPGDDTLTTAGSEGHVLSAHALPFVPRLAEPSAELPAGLSPAPTLIQGGLLPATLPTGLPLTACAPPFAQSSASDFDRRPTVRPDSYLADGALPSLPNPPQTLHSFWHPAPTLSPDPISRTFDFTLESPAYCAPLLSEPLLQTHSFMLPAF